MTQGPETLQELQLESRLGGEGFVDNSRSIPLIDLADCSDLTSLDDSLWNAATQHGFFQLSNHGIDASVVASAFSQARQFFDLPFSVKSQYPLKATSNTGWEYSEQVRPSTGRADRKESYQITASAMTGMWPTKTELPNFKTEMLAFEQACWRLGMRVLSSFARKLGFDSDFFTQAHNPHADDYKSTLRLLHYFGLGEGYDGEAGEWRAGAHTDFDCLTLLFQRDGQHGLQVCPGKEADTMVWTPVVAKEALITCNIGDMLMRWSDDQLRSTLHRVAMPLPAQSHLPRYSLAFFCQANSSQLIAGPGKKYQPITAGEYLDQRIAANFEDLQGKQ